MAGEYVFNLVGVTKQHEKKTVLEDVHLAFFYGAHIGVIGANGAGKSTLLRILAGEDADFLGQCHIAKNVRIGHLPQEPRLDPGKTVMQAVEEGVAASRAVLARYDEVCEKLGVDLPAAEQAKLNDEMGRLQETIDSRDLWNLDHLV